MVANQEYAGGYAISRQNNLELHLSCHTCLLSYFTLVYLWCGRTVARSGGVRSRDYQLGWMDFLGCGALRVLGAPLRCLLVVTGGGVLTFLEFKTKNVALKHTKATCLHAKARGCTVQTESQKVIKVRVAKRTLWSWRRSVGHSRSFFPFVCERCRIYIN